MKKIYVKPNTSTLVDDEDYESLVKYSWYLNKGGYAVHHSTKKLLYMHREIMHTPNGLVTDHINRDKLDNRKQNLRITNQVVNTLNARLRSNNKSGHRGVCLDKRNKTNPWRVQFNLDYIGNFKDKHSAIEEYHKKYDECCHGVNYGN